MVTNVYNVRGEEKKIKKREGEKKRTREKTGFF